MQPKTHRITKAALGIALALAFFWPGPGTARAGPDPLPPTTGPAPAGATRTTTTTTMTTAPAAEDDPDLQRRIPELNLESSTLQAAIDAVRNSARANVIVAWDDLESAGIPRDAPVRLHLWDVTVERALAAILSVAGGDFASMHAVKDGILVIATGDKLRSGAGAVRIYDVRDVVADIIRFHLLPPPAPATQPITQTSARADPSSIGAVSRRPDAPMTIQEAVDELVKVIEDDVDTDTWKDNGGSVGSIRELAGRLIVTTTPATHHKLVALLRTLRAGGSKEGTDLQSSGR